MRESADGRAEAESASYDAGVVVDASAQAADASEAIVDAAAERGSDAPLEAATEAAPADSGADGSEASVDATTDAGCIAPATDATCYRVDTEVLCDQPDGTTWAYGSTSERHYRATDGSVEVICVHDSRTGHAPP